MKRLIWFVPILILLCACAFEQKVPDPPNIIIIYADDLGYGELGSFGQEKIETPNLDRLTAEGMKFMEFYTGSPVCAPSRCILLTGMHSGHAAVRGNDEAGWRGDVWSFKAMQEDSYLEGQEAMADSVLTIAEVLQEQNYRTGLIGKWGLGYPTSESTPNKQGFDYFYGFNCQRQAHNLTPLHLWENEERVYLQNDTLIPHQVRSTKQPPQTIEDYQIYANQPDYAPTLMTEKVLDFVSSEEEKPFFLYWATPIPHLPLQAPKKWVDHYREKFGPEDPYDGLNGYFPCQYPKATYAAMISYLDENVGKLMDALKEQGISDNTLILFSSDNGPTYTGGTDTPWFNSAGPFKEEYGWGKGFTREGGIRVPMVARWPDKITSGTTSDHMGSMQDLFATLIDASGASSRPSDGISFLPTLIGEGDQSTHDHLYWEFPSYGGQRALRWGDYKAYNGDLLKGDTTIQIYNLKEDIQEQHDISESNPELVEYVREIFKKEHIPSHNPRWQYAALGEKSKDP